MYCVIYEHYRMHLALQGNFCCYVVQLWIHLHTYVHYCPPEVHVLYKMFAFLVIENSFPTHDLINS